MVAIISLQFIFYDGTSGHRKGGQRSQDCPGTCG
jgi:hypothetical protein